MQFDVCFLGQNRLSERRPVTTAYDPELTFTVTGLLE
jgi:hypothetical protein